MLCPRHLRIADCVTKTSCQVHCSPTASYMILQLRTSPCMTSLFTNQQSITRLIITFEVEQRHGIASASDTMSTSCSTMLQYLHPTANYNGVSSLPQISVQWLPWLECDTAATKETHSGGSLHPGAQPLLYQRLVSKCDLHDGAIFSTSGAMA